MDTGLAPTLDGTLAPAAGSRATMSLAEGSPGPPPEEGAECFNVLVFTDEPAAAAGLSRVLPGAGLFRLCGVHDNLRNLEAALFTVRPGVLLLDRTPDTAIPIIHELRRRVPNCRILLWLRTVTPPAARQAAEHGVCGILRKTASIEAVFKCLEVVAQGGLWFEGLLEGDSRESEFARLTRREGQLVGLISSGLKNKEVAAEMGISEGAVKVYLSRLFRKLGVDSRTELAIQALRNAWVAETNLEPALMPGQSRRRESVTKSPVLRSFTGWAPSRGQLVHPKGPSTGGVGSPAARSVATAWGSR